MSRFHLYRHRVVLIVVLLGIAALGSQSVQADSAQVATVARSPSLIESSISPEQGALAVRGADFTPGGKVLVTLYDPWAMYLPQPRWVTATASVHGPDGSQDPARGFSRGGQLDHVLGSYTIYGPDGSQDPALGFSRIGPILSAESVYGPNGSQDPALGYVEAGNGSFCGSAMMVRAYDASTSQWSNVIDIDLSC